MQMNVKALNQAMTVQVRVYNLQRIWPASIKKIVPHPVLEGFYTLGQRNKIW